MINWSKKSGIPKKRAFSHLHLLSRFFLLSGLCLTLTAFSSQGKKPLAVKNEEIRYSGHYKFRHLNSLKESSAKKGALYSLSFASLLQFPTRELAMYFFSPDDFRDHWDFLQKRVYKKLSLEEIKRLFKKTIEKKEISLGVIHFYDGFTLKNSSRRNIIGIKIFGNTSVEISEIILIHSEIQKKLPFKGHEIFYLFDKKKDYLEHKEKLGAVGISSHY